MRIAACQLNQIVGDLEGNASRIIEAYQLNKDKVDLVVCPEMATTGYPPHDLLLIPEFIQKQEEKIKEIAAACIGKAAILFGAVLPIGKHLTNVALFCVDGELKQMVLKSLFPTYDVFDESRYFKNLGGVAWDLHTPVDGYNKYEPLLSYPYNVVKFRGSRIGVTICEDMWDKGYDSDPVGTCKSEIDFMVNISASPWYRGKVQERIDIATRHAKNLNVPFVYVNQCGGNDELFFDGSSFMVAPDGKYQLSHFAEGGEYYFDTEWLGESGQVKDNDMYAVYTALVESLHDYFHKNGFTKAVLGVSGGIDSAVVLCLLCDALDKDNVTAMFLPTQNSSTESYLYAKRLCENLGVELNCIDISNTFNVVGAAAQPILKNITLENIQARIRALLLMAKANDENGLLVTTGNKTELGMAYYTMYGDSCGGINPLGDLNKEEVYELANYINEVWPGMIPQFIIDRPPSAELSENQVDPFDYKTISSQVDEVISGENLSKYPSIANTVMSTEWKRRQCPFCIKVSKKSFGIGRRMPITNRFRMEGKDGVN